MTQIKLFYKMSMLFLTLLLIAGMVGCSSQDLLQPEDIPTSALAEEVPHAKAWNLIFFPWPMENDSFTEGPYKGYKIYSNDGTLSGYRIYKHINQGSFRPEDIESHYEKKLVERWQPEEERWQRLDNLDVTYNGWVWQRGKQVFLVVCANDENVKSFHTYLLNK